MHNNFSTLHELHTRVPILRLPNAWDAASARLFQDVGAVAIATSSAALAWSLGYSDGGMLPVNETVAATARIARVPRVPLSVDLENGYSSDPAKVAENVLRIVEAGAVGINIEDGTDEPETLARKILAIKNAVAQRGLNVFVNARTDVFLRKLAREVDQCDEALARARIYLDAGADGLFVPAIFVAEQIEKITAGTALPVNALAWPSLPDAQVLEKLGVRRLSAGSAIPQILWQHASMLAQGFLGQEGPASVEKGQIAFGTMQDLFNQA